MNRITDLVNNYRLFLKSNWLYLNEHINIVHENRRDYILNEFLQANWEIFVESCIFEDKNIFIKYYGEGADSEPYSRVSYPNGVPEYEVYCYSKNKYIYDHVEEKMIECDNMSFEYFNSLDYERKNPSKNIINYDIFDTVIVYDDYGEIHIFNFDDLVFDIRKLNYQE